MGIVVAAFYHFFAFPQARAHCAPVLYELERLSIKGTILLTPEGINGTVSGARQSINELLFYLREHITREAFSHKESLCSMQPFRRTKVKFKKETISLGEPVIVNNASVGEYVDAKTWNNLLDDPETIVIDARNAYEIELGTFRAARNPNTQNFKELPAYIRETLKDHKHRKIATFCTGGIRCEKFTAWLRSEGFERVYHLQGGILKYLEETALENSKWQGQCFVFDERLSVGHDLNPTNSPE